MRWADRIIKRLRAEASPELAKKLLTAAFVLSGLRVDQEIALQLFRGVQAMHESSTYQYLLDEGHMRGQRQTLLLQGRKRFGEPDVATRAALEAINDLDRLNRMAEHLLDAASWQELLATP